MTQQVQPDTYDVCTRISMRRKHLWTDSVSQFLKRSFNPKKSIRVIFGGEETVDRGVPRMEYSRLLCLAIKETSGVFYIRENISFRLD